MYSTGINTVSFLKGMTIVIAVLAVAVLGLAIFRTVKLKRTRKLPFALLCLPLAVIIAVNLVLGNYGVLVTNFMGTKNDEAAVTAAADASRELTEEIQSEGIVLLENKNEVLPLSDTKVNVFGYSSQQIVYGGSGSGSSDETANVTLRAALEASGFTMNEELIEFYAEHEVEKEDINIFDLFGNDYNMYEHPSSAYEGGLLQNAVDFSDTALVVFSRNGGEGGDLPMDMGEYEGGTAGRHYLQLAEAEEDLLQMVRENFGKVVVIVNSSNAMELGFVEEFEVDGALWIGGPGSTGLNALGRILAGEVNPSGRLVDTYAYDITKSPAYYNAGDFSYSGSEHEEISEVGGIQLGTKMADYKFLDYAEGIYVGYRYYETRWVDNATGEPDEDAYGAEVQYPFGYGLSYTDFEQEIIGFNTDGGTITVEVAVKNTGSSSGKETAQVYFTAPYTIGGIEKSHVVLGGFEKTAILEPGESETLTIEFSIEDMASYDYENERAYVLEVGEYEIKLMANAHEVIDSRTYDVPSTIVYDETNKRESDKAAVTNQFDDVYSDGISETVYVSRADWEDTLPVSRAEEREISSEIMARLDDQSVQVEENAEPIVHAKNGLKLYDMTGLDYDDPKWEQILEQLSVKEMTDMLGQGGYNTMQINSVEKPKAIDVDGPAGVNGLLSGVVGVQFPSEVVVASTWNKELARKMGETMGKESVASRVSGLYAPAVNIHRTPFAGRNFEYYSEDPYLSGVMAAEMVKGAAEEGVYCFVKHFALNDQEDNREGVATWSNEQAIREIYLKAFEIPVKDGGATGMMSSFNRLGTTWAGASSALLETVLREEWGFRGLVITDFFGGGYMDANMAVANGNDLMLTPLGAPFSEEITKTDWGHQKLRQASKNALYTVANSNAFDVAETGMPGYMLVYLFINLLLLALIGLGYWKATDSKKVAEKRAAKAAAKVS